MAIRVVLYDNGQVLTNTSGIGSEEHDFLLERDVDITRDDYERQFRPFKAGAQTRKVYSSREAAFEAFLSKLERPDLIDPYRQAVALRGERHPNPPSLVLPGVRETLQSLQDQGIANVVLTDSTRSLEELQTFFERAHLLRYLHPQGIYASTALGTTKPDPLFFGKPLDDLHIKKDEALFVGHSLDELAGAHAFGLVVAAVNYDHELRDTGELAFLERERGDRGHFLDDIRRLRPLVRKLNRE